MRTPSTRCPTTSSGDPVGGAGVSGTQPPGRPMRDRLVFSHANGFPVATYRRLLSTLAGRFEVSGVERFGHGPDYPVARGWHGLARQLVDHIEALPVDGRTWLVGHSLGGYLSVLAAARVPTRVAGVVLLDSPLIGRWTERVLKIGRRTGLDRHLMPLRQTLQRRTHWTDVEAVTAHFAAKPGFARWHPEVLRDYATHGTGPDPAGGRRLWFDRDIEHRIYGTLPTGSVRTAAMGLPMPVAFIGGLRSREVAQIGLRTTRQVVGARVQWVEGGHLYPMERPDETATRILAAIDECEAAAGHRAA